MVGWYGCMPLGARPRANQLEVDGLAPICRSFDPHRDIRSLGQRSCPCSARVAINRRVHIGWAGGHLERSSPAAENSGAQSGEGAAPAGFSTCWWNCDELRKATERIEADQRHPRQIERRVVRPYGSQHWCIREREGEMSREGPRAAAIPKHERTGFEVVPARL